MSFQWEKLFRMKKYSFWMKRITLWKKKIRMEKYVYTGSALALGYYQNPEQTAKAFVQNPLNDRYLEPMYRTGDLAYYNNLGELCFATRKDFQIKHMGHRIELGEIRGING